MAGRARGRHRLSLAAIQGNQAELLAWRDAQAILAGLVFLGGHVAVTAPSQPGAAVMTHFVINLAMGVTRLRIWTFCWVSHLIVIGGDGLNTGCVPSKALVCSATFLSHRRPRWPGSSASTPGGVADDGPEGTTPRQTCSRGPP